MANICDGCGETVYRNIYQPESHKWLGVDCGCTRKARLTWNVESAFKIKLEHVHDEFGKPVSVNSIREMSAAEKRYGFQSVVLNADAQNFNDPPQQRRIEMRDVHNWKFSQRRGH